MGTMRVTDEARKSGNVMRFTRRAGRACVLGCAALFLLQIVSAIAGWHGAPLRWLSAQSNEAVPVPEYIVVLGGGGIPSESGLLRCYYAGKLGSIYPDARFVVSLHADGDPETQSVGRMRDELVMRGIPRESVLLERRGLNTHEQAVEVRKLLGEAALLQPVLVVTSASHVRRSLLCFRAEGFQQVFGTAAVSTGAEADIGSGGLWRYTFWNNLEMQIRIVRECTALLYYKGQGWI